MPFLLALVCRWCDLGYYRNVSAAIDPDSYCCAECERDDPEA